MCFAAVIASCITYIDDGFGCRVASPAKADSLGADSVAALTMQADLDRLQQQNIPVDIVLKQGREVLGL